jgi:hypothetical protein
LLKRCAEELSMSLSHVAPFVAILLGAPCAMAQAQERVVTKVVVESKADMYKGACPTELKFTGTVFVSRHPITVTYQWERSDGTTTTEKVEVASSKRSLTSTWKVGTAGQSATVWEKLHVLSPTGISSDAANVTLNCQ